MRYVLMTEPQQGMSYADQLVRPRDPRTRSSSLASASGSQIAFASEKASSSPLARSAAAFCAGTLPARASSRTRSRPAAARELDGAVGGAVGGDDHLEPLARVVERERVRDLRLDHRLLVVRGDDQARRSAAGRRLRRAARGGEPASSASSASGYPTCVYTIRPTLAQKAISTAVIERRLSVRASTPGRARASGRRSRSHEYGPCAAARAAAARARSRLGRRRAARSSAAASAAASPGGTSRSASPCAATSAKPADVAGDDRPCRRRAPCRGRRTARPRGTEARRGRRGERAPGSPGR